MNVLEDTLLRAFSFFAKMKPAFRSAVAVAQRPVSALLCMLKDIGASPGVLRVSMRGRLYMVPIAEVDVLAFLHTNGLFWVRPPKELLASFQIPAPFPGGPLGFSWGAEGLIVAAGPCDEKELRGLQGLP